MSLASLTKRLKTGGVLIPVLMDYVLETNRAIEAGERRKKQGVLVDSCLTIAAMAARIEEFNHGEIMEDNLFHPSALGDCMRRHWYKHFHAPGSTQSAYDPLTSYMTFEQGTYVHLIIQNLCEQAGVLESREIAIHSPKFRILGHCDGIVNVATIRYVLEIKSISSYQFNQLSAGPKHGHKIQAHEYMKGLGINTSIILYYQKDTSVMKEFVIPFDEDFYQTYSVRRKDDYFTGIKTGVPPSREGAGPTDPICKYCPYQGVCLVPSDDKKFIAHVRRSLG